MTSVKSKQVIYISRFLGQVMLIVSGAMLPSFLIAIFQKENAVAFLAPIAGLTLIGVALQVFLPRPERRMYAKEGFLVVGLAWILLSLAGAVPFVISGAIPNFLDAFFESVSGFTTTGASILKEVESLPRGILFWRSFTHWLGGMGILVFLLAVSTSSGRNVYIMRAESPGPSKDKMMPRLRDIAKTLYGIYVVMTVIEIVLLIAGGMPVFDSFCHAFGTAGTGGFSIKNASIAAYHSPYLEWVITIFMALFGVNFNLYYLLLLRRFSEALKGEEVRWYFLIILAAIGIIVVNLLTGMSGIPFGEALRQASFQVSSIITTTGYSSVDFASWPQLSQNILLVLMFIGACGCSTGGGIKVSRIIILFKEARNSAIRLLHPNSTQVVRLEGKALDREVVHRAFSFFVIYVTIFVVSMLIVSIDNHGLATTSSGVAACLNNIGPGLEMVGPLGNFSVFSQLSKFVLSLDMLLGRLEIFPILLLFSPGLWRER